MNGIEYISQNSKKYIFNNFMISISIRILVILIIFVLEKYFFSKTSITLKNNTNSIYSRNLISFNNLLEPTFKEKFNSTYCEYFCSSKNSICIEKNKNYEDSDKNMILKVLYSREIDEIFNFNNDNDYSFSNLKESLQSLKKINDEIILKCVCLPGYVTYYNNYNEVKYYCNYKQKLSIIAAALEIVFGFGIGHTYSERTLFGLGKFFFSLAIWILLMFIEGILSHKSINKLIIMSKILLIFIRTWQFIDFFLFYFKIYYKDGNGISLY